MITVDTLAEAEKMQAAGKSWQEIKQTLIDPIYPDKTDAPPEILSDDDIPHSGHIWHNHTAPGHFMCERPPTGMYPYHTVILV